MSLTKVTTNGLTDETIDAGKIADGGLSNADIAPGTVTTAKLAGSIANAKLANESITINSSATALGASISDVGKIAWQSKVTSDGSTVTTMVAGRGYFIDNSSAAGLVKLPASASAGDTVIVKDYAGNFGTNSLTIQRNGHNIQGVANDSEIKTDKAAVTLVYIDSTKGWLVTAESNVQVLTPVFTSATGGTVTTSGNFKIHTFTGDANFVVSTAGNTAGGTDKVSYMVVAGGGGGGGGPGANQGKVGGGGGAGGFREGRVPNDSYTVSPLNNAGGLTITATTFPVTVGGGGNGQETGGGQTNGSNSVFSTITSAGGGAGGGAASAQNAERIGNSGGSGGGGAREHAGGSGNTPPVSPPQGNSGSTGPNVSPDTGDGGGGGGGATAAGATGPHGRDGGAGATTHITGSPVVYAGGGGGSARITGYPGGSGGSGGGGDGSGPGTPNVSAGTANRGGGGGAGGGNCTGSPAGGGIDVAGKAGGSGIVIIRYKYQ